MKNILLSILILASNPLSATEKEVSTVKQESRKPVDSYTLQPKVREIGHDNYKNGAIPMDEYPVSDGNIPETQPTDKSNLPPS